MGRRKDEEEQELQQHDPFDDHEHDWVDAVEGDDVCGQVCTVCGIMRYPEED